MVEVGEETFQTKEMENELNPDWNEDFTFNVPEGLEVVSVSIWDKNSIKKDVFMGYTFVVFDNCLQGQSNKRVSAYIIRTPLPTIYIYENWKST